MTAFVQPTKPNLIDYLTFIREAVGIGPAYLPDDSFWIQGTFSMAVSMVNDALVRVPTATGGSSIYVLACYNFGADRLLNFALDEPGQSFFRDMRTSLGLHNFQAGLVTASSDQGTSQALEIIEAAKRMTLTDLQMMKTPYGRAYLDLAQSYGSTVWGLTR